MECGAGRSSASAARDHVGFEMTAGAGVHLNDRGAGGTDAIPVERGGLVALQNADRMAGLHVADRALQQGRLAGAG